MNTPHIAGKAPSPSTSKPVKPIIGARAANRRTNPSATDRIKAPTSRRWRGRQIPIKRRFSAPANTQKIVRSVMVRISRFNPIFHDKI